MLKVVIDTLLPAHADASLPYGAWETDFETFYRKFKQAANINLRRGFQAALFTAAWISPLLIHRLPPLSLYQRDTRERALSAMATSRFYLMRQMMLILKLVISYCYGANRDVRDAIGYPRLQIGNNGKNS